MLMWDKFKKYLVLYRVASNLFISSLKTTVMW